MKIQRFLCLFTLSALLCGCQAQGDSTTSESAETTSVTETTTVSSAENTPSQKELNFPSYEEIQSEYPDKNVLVWVIEETLYERNYPFRTAEVNDYLDEKGYDFAVCFVPIRVEEQTYTAQVTDMVNSGEQVDIIYASFTTSGEAGSNSYHKYIYNGLFSPLDAFFDTAEGKTLYELMPEKHWEALRVNGQIYGVDGSMQTLSLDYGYYVNAELAEKYGYDIHLPLEEQIEILEQVKSTEKKCDVFAAWENYTSFAYYANIQSITSAVYWDDTEHRAKSALDNVQYADRLRLFYTLKQKGLLVNPEMQESFFILQTNFCPGAGLVWNADETISVPYGENTVEAYPIFPKDTAVRQAYCATGISTASQHPDMAFRLLALTQTDAYLNNLLTYGAQGEDYELADGIVSEVQNCVSLDRFANYMICHPYQSNGFCAEDYRTIFAAASVSEDIGFAFDGREMISQTQAIDEVLSAFMLSTDQSFDDMLNTLKTELEQAGIQEVMDECNRQYGS